MKEILQEDIMAEYSGSFRLLRRSLGLTQMDLSFMSGISKLTISKIENGSFRGNINILQRLSDCMNSRVGIKLIINRYGV